MSPGQLSFPVIACVRNSVVCRSHELAVNRNHALCMELKHAVQTHHLNWTPAVQFGRDHLLLVPPSALCTGKSSRCTIEQAEQTLKSWSPHLHISDARMCVYESVSTRSVPLSDKNSFPPCARIFIAICHDVISPGTEQSYLFGRSQPCPAHTHT